MTADHVVVSDCSNHAYHSKVYNYDSDGNFVGHIQDYSKSQDWAIMDVPSDSDISGTTGSIRNENGSLSGHMTLDGLKELKSSNETVHQSGWKTCMTSGEVEEVKVGNSRCDGSYKSDDYVKTSAMTEGGDSGGPHYRKYNTNRGDFLAIIAPHRGGDSIGCGAYKINDDHNISFDFS